MVPMRSVIVAAGVALAAVVLGAPGPLEQGACMNDVKALCGSVQPGGGRIRECMSEHRAGLSAACKTAIADRVLERTEHRGAGGAGGAAIRSVPGAAGAAALRPMPEPGN
jgi:hypothetical protein